MVNGKHKSCVVYHVNNYQETRFISLDVVDTSNKTLAKSILNITYIIKRSRITLLYQDTIIEVTLKYRMINNALLRKKVIQMVCIRTVSHFSILRKSFLRILL